jgi:Uri superfamily endonuclease
VQKIINPDSGIYLLEFKSENEFKLQIKKYPGINFSKGYYYYAGSAQKNFSHRVKRHVTKSKKLYWHIDYLTANKNLKMKNIFAFPGIKKEAECKLVQNLIKNFDLDYAIKGFGNGDCNSCDSHLLFSKRILNQSQLFSRYQSIVRLIPSSIETV